METFLSADHIKASDAGGLKQYFVESRVNVNDVHQLFQSDVEIHQCRNFLNDGSGIGSHDMAPDNLGIGLLAVTDELHKTFGSLYGLCLAVAAVEAFVNGIVGVLGIGAVLGQSHWKPPRDG